MSVNAPPPMTPIGDARLDSAPVPLCRTIATVRLGHCVERAATVVDAPTSIDGWLQSERIRLPEPPVSKVWTATATGLVQSPSHGDGVFRPPREA
jgi:hypothetical protein